MSPDNIYHLALFALACFALGCVIGLLVGRSGK